MNLGHTFAHAIEWEARAAKKDALYGEAVAMGIILAAKASERYYGRESIEGRQVARRVSKRKVYARFQPLRPAYRMPVPPPVKWGGKERQESRKRHCAFRHSPHLDDVRIENLLVSTINT